MERIIAFFGQPHPAHTDPRVYLRTISIICALIFFTLYILKPFDWDRLDNERLLPTAAISSIATFAALLLFYIWLWLFPSFFDERKWTIGKELLLVIHQFSIVSLSVWSVRNYFSHYWDIPQRSYVLTWWVVSSTGMIPYLLATSLKHIYHLRQYVRRALLMNEDLPTYRRDPNAKLRLAGMADAIQMDDFLFLEAQGNYVEAYASDGGEIKHWTVRCTLAQIEAANKDKSNLFRCHRAFIVNLDRLLHISGNAAGYQLTLHQALPTIPVSRSSANAFKQRLASIACHSSQIIAKYP